MNVELFALCDAATGDFGKLSMLGAFDTLWVDSLPATHPHCAIALRLRFRSVEAARHTVRVTLMDENGKHAINPMEGQIEVKFPDSRSSVSVNLILNMQGLKFEKAGEYSIDMALDGRQEASLPLFVNQKKPH